jgi:glycosyltransferase involved in cell wall biosynthesis
MNELISVVIPAYSEPLYLEKALKSLVRQTYRPIEVIISDDNSPQSLEGLVKKLLVHCDSTFKIRYFRQQENLGYYWNLEFVSKQAIGKYIVMLDHDDWFIDKNHFSDSINYLETFDDCNFCVSNVLLESSPFPMLQIDFRDWHSLDSQIFMKDYLFGTLHPVRGAIVMRLDRLKQINYFDYFINKIDAKKMNINLDEAFVSLILLCFSGVVSFRGLPVMMRGQPQGSLSSSTNWQLSFGLKTFIQHYYMYKFFKRNNHGVGMRLMIENLIFNHPPPFLNFRMLRFLNYELDACKIMTIGVVSFRLRWFFVLPKRVILKLKAKAIKAIELFFGIR